MAKQGLRQFLMFEGLIQRVPDPSAAVDDWYDRHPEYAETAEERLWESWRISGLPPLLPQPE